MTGSEPGESAMTRGRREPPRRATTFRRERSRAFLPPKRGRAARGRLPAMIGARGIMILLRPGATDRVAIAWVVSSKTLAEPVSSRCQRLTCCVPGNAQSRWLGAFLTPGVRAANTVVEKEKWGRAYCFFPHDIGTAF